MYIARFKISTRHFNKQTVSFFILEGSLNLQIIEIQDQSLIFQVEFKNFDYQKIANNFKKIFPNVDLELIFEKKLEYEEWKRMRLRSLEIGIFKFKPIFQKTEKEENEFIYLDTLVGAFGIDQHPTTLICLELLSDYAEEIKKGKIAVDFGVGNGILSLALWKLGVPQIIAIEIFYNYCLESKRNFIINRVSNAKVINFSSMKIIKSTDILTANVPFSTYKDKESNLLESKFKIAVFSGITKENQENLLKMFETHKIIVRELREKDNWLGFLVKKDRKIC